MQSSPYPWLARDSGLSVPHTHYGDLCAKGTLVPLVLTHYSTLPITTSIITSHGWGSTSKSLWWILFAVINYWCQIWISLQPELLTLSTLSPTVLSCLVAAVREVRSFLSIFLLLFLTSSTKLDSVTIISSCLSPKMEKRETSSVLSPTTKGIQFNTKLLN